MESLLPKAVRAAESGQVPQLNDANLAELGMVLERLAGDLQKEPDVVRALAAFRAEHWKRQSSRGWSQWVISAIEERSEPLKESINDLERRNEARKAAGLPPVDDEVLWKAPQLGALGAWGATTFGTQYLQVSAVSQMEELLRLVAFRCGELRGLPATALSDSSFWAVGNALELYANTLPKADDSAPQEGLDRVKASMRSNLSTSYMHWCHAAKEFGPAPHGESLLSRDITVNAAVRELESLRREDETKI